MPKLPSHYCRANTNRLYLQPDIPSFSELFRIYTDYCRTNTLDTVAEKKFRKIVQDENMSLFSPKKDQCDICCGHQTGNLDDATYNEHIKKKTEAREEKAKDKENALGEDLIVLTVDLQAVLLAPSLKASAMYYKSKLACHNYTVYNLTTRDVVCYFWHEGEADLGCNTFASCLVHYIEQSIGEIKNIIIYSDGCTYQNRNVTIANALLDLAVRKQITITQKILEKGHTQMECNSVHGTIERGLRNKPIYVPANYVDVMQNARLTNPYTVKHVDHTFFTDFSNVKMYSSIRPGTRVGDQVVTDLRVIRYSSTGIITYATNYIDELQELPRKAKVQNRSRETSPLFNGKQRIKDSKFKHLMDLKAVIPRDYHSFYDELAHD